MWQFGEGMAWWMVFGGVWMFLFWGGFIWLVVWAVRRSTNRGPDSKSSPLDIAKERYARGELTKEEYERLKQDLS